jgi:arylsulfatase A
MVSIKRKTKILASLLLLVLMMHNAYANTKQPNVVIVLADDLGIESLKTYGGHSTVTPNIDKLAEEGMLFTHCFANPKCTPSRAEFLSGTYPGITGLSKVLTHFRDKQYLDPLKFNSFANQFKKAGYATAVAGKWNISYLEKNNTVNDLGFDQYCLWQMYDKEGKKRSRYYHPYLRKNNQILEKEVEDKFGPDVICDFIINFIEENKSQPFMVYYPSLIPHTPYVRVPDNPEAVKLPDNQLKHGAECFPEMVNYLDKNVGRITAALEKNGLAENTIVVFLADNGTHDWVTSIWGDDKVEIIGGKSTMTDRGSRVPLIVKWPDKIMAGTKCDDLIEFADFMPTFCEIADAPQPKQKIYGQSFYPQLTGEKGNPREWVHIEWRNFRQIRTKDWIYTNDDKLIKVNKVGEPENSPEKEGSHKKTRRELNNILTSVK